MSNYLEVYQNKKRELEKSILVDKPTFEVSEFTNIQSADDVLDDTSFLFGQLADFTITGKVLSLIHI